MAWLAAIDVAEAARVPLSQLGRDPVVGGIPVLGGRPGSVTDDTDIRLGNLCIVASRLTPIVAVLLVLRVAQRCRSHEPLGAVPP